MDFQQKTVYFATPGLTGARLFLFFPGLDADRLQQGRPSFSCSSTYCTNPTSTTSEMRTVVRGAVSPTADEAIVSALNRHCRVSLTAFRRDTIFSRRDFKFAITGPASTPIAPQGSNLALFRTASAAVTAVFSMLIPVSEKKFLCVNRGLRTKSCTNAITPITFSWSIATSFSDTVKTGCNSEGSFTLMLSTGKSESSTCVKSWEHWTNLKHHKTSFVKCPPKTESRLVTECNDAADWHMRSIAACFHLPLLADKRMKFSFCRFNFGPTNPAKFKQPIQQLPKEVEGRMIVTSNDDLRTKTAQSSPNRRTRGNCREDGSLEILKEATTVFTEFFSEEATVYFFKNDSWRVPSENCSSAIATKHEWFGRMYASHFSLTSKSLLRFTFYSKPYTNKETTRMTDSYNWHAQSPIPWNCVQLKQHR